MQLRSYLAAALGLAFLLPANAFKVPGSRLLNRLPNPSARSQRYKLQAVATKETTATESSSPSLSTTGRRLDPKQVANAARKEITHILICPGFATSSEEYTEEGSLAPNLVGRGGWKKEQIHVLPVERLDWLKCFSNGLRDADYRAALLGIAGKTGAPPDRLPYRWYLNRVAKAIREIDEGVKREYGPDKSAKVILIGHSAGGWLARAAVGFGCEHKKNATELEPELGIDINNILAFVTLGTPNLPPPEGSPDSTGGALKITNERFPGSYFEDKVFYVTLSGSGVDANSDAMAREAYKMVAGQGQTDGDGIVPTGSAHLEGATQINLENIYHAAQLVTEELGDVWYGSDVVVEEWFSEVLEQLAYIQAAEEVLQEPYIEENVAEAPQEEVLQELREEQVAEPVESEDKEEPEDSSEKTDGVEHYFRRRNALRHSGIFQSIPNRKAFESLVYSMEGFSVPIGEKLFSQGDDADAMFFIRRGEFECFNDITGEVIATVGKNEVVGELGVLTGAPRSLSVRAASPDAVVFKLSSQDIKKYVLEEESMKVASSLQEDERYEGYFEEKAKRFEEKAKREALKACPIFKELGEEDLERLIDAMQRMEIPKGERIIEEGTRGGSMYFVEDGQFACYRESNKNVVKVCEGGDYFGELGVIFEKPRAVSVLAARPSTVWELHGDVFLDCYRKMTAAKYGSASWLLPLGKAIRADKWLGRVVPKPLSRAVVKLRFGIRHFMNQFRIMGDHFEEDRWKGTKTHISNALLSTAIPLYFLFRQASAGSALSKFIMHAGFAGLVFDNLVNASGKYIGEGDALKRLCKLRSISHGFTIPLLFLPVIETGMNSGLFPARAAKVAMGAVAAFALHEVIDWIKFDIKDMVLVDNRDAKKPSASAMAGTLWYSSGKVLKNVVPAATLQLFMIAVGSVLWKRGAAGGPWLLASGILTLVSCSLQRPDVQAYGEPTMMGLLWAAAAAL